MAAYQRLTPDAQGVYTIPAGRWFIDTTTERFVQVWPKLLALIPKSSVLEWNDSQGRGFMMASFHFNEPVTIPREVYLGTGFFYELPKGESLNTVSRNLYGETYQESRGFWEWLSAEHPALFKAAQSTAEAVVETGEAVKESLTSGGKALLWGAGGVLAVFLLVSLAKRSRARELEDY